MHVAERIRRLLGIDDAGEYFEIYVQRTNANLAQYAGIAVAIIELMLFINVMVHKGAYDSATNRMNRAHAISFLVFAAISLLLSLLARYLIKRDRVRDMMVPVSIYVYLAVGYGIFNSYIDSLHGEPPQVHSFHAFAKVPGASIGYAYGHATTSEELRELVRLFDASLYEVKRSGKGETSGKALTIAVSEE